MLAKLVTLCTFVAVSTAVFVPTAVHYSPASAVSSHSIVRHDQPSLVAAKVYTPVAKVAVASPVVYHTAPAPIAYHAVSTPIAYHTPIAKIVSQPEQIAYPKYEFNYSVADGHTGDNKQQQESRDGDVVKGSYSFLEADGSIRSVEYSADDHNGFNAIVHNSAPTHTPTVLKAPVLAAPEHQLYYH